MSDPESISKLRHDLRAEILSNATLAEHLRMFAEKDAVYVPCAGNFGDGLIGLGTLDLFRETGINPRIHDSLKEGVLPPSGYAIVGGGGGWFDGLWDHYATILKPFLDAGGQVLILPSTVLGFQHFFEKYAGQITVFARERNTFERLDGYSGMHGRVHMMHDLAFATDFAVFGDGPDINASSSRDGVLNMFREDEESNISGYRKRNYDLSLLWNVTAWYDRQDCIRKLRPVVQLLSQIKTVRTDRLHMSILATLLGCDVVMYPSRYFKNQAVFDYSLCSFPNIRFSSETDVSSPVPMASDMTPAEDDDDVDVMRKKLDAYERAYQNVNDELQLTRERNLQYTRYLDNLRNSSSPEDDLSKLQNEISVLAEELDRTRSEFDLFKTQTQRREQTMQAEHEQILHEQSARENAFIHSRGYRLWNSYNHLYQLPVVGSLLNTLRAMFKKLK